MATYKAAMFFIHSRVLPALILTACLVACGGSAASGPSPWSDGGKAGDAAVDDLPDAASELDASTGDAEVPPSDGGLDVHGPLFQSGSRLRARLVSEADQVVAVEGFHDTELGLACSFRRATDGNFYCLPEVRESFGAFAAYTDSACTQGAVLEAFACTLGPRLHVLSKDLCDRRAEVFRVSSKASSSWYESDLHGNCVARSNEEQRAYPVEEAVPLSAFVRAELRTSVGPGLVREMWLGSDGSRATRGPRSANGGACEPKRVLTGAETERLRCVPLARAYQTMETWFADEQCIEPVAYALALTETCPAPELVIKPSLQGAECQVGGRQNELFLLGNLREVAYERDFHLTCGQVAGGRETGFSFFEIGASFDASALPVVEPKLLGSGRLRAYAWHNTEGHALGYLPAEPLPAETSGATPLIWDEDLQTRCELIAVGEEWLCAPPRALLVYDDAACETPLLEAFGGEDCPLDVPGIVSVRGTPTFECGAQSALPALALYRVGAALSAPAKRHIRFQGQCQEAVSPAIAARYFALGASLPNAMLARLSKRIE